MDHSAHSEESSVLGGQMPSSPLVLDWIWQQQSLFCCFGIKTCSKWRTALFVATVNSSTLQNKTRTSVDNLGPWRQSWSPSVGRTWWHFSTYLETPCLQYLLLFLKCGCAFFCIVMSIHTSTPPCCHKWILKLAHIKYNSYFQQMLCHKDSPQG